jgi:hypothetical protein
MPHERGQHLITFVDHRKDRKRGREIENSWNFIELDVKTLLLQELARRLQLVSKITPLTNSYYKLLRLG